MLRLPVLSLSFFADFRFRLPLRIVCLLYLSLFSLPFLTSSRPKECQSVSNDVKKKKNRRPSARIPDRKPVRIRAMTCPIGDRGEPVIAISRTSWKGRSRYFKINGGDRRHRHDAK